MRRYNLFKFLTSLILAFSLSALGYFQLWPQERAGARAELAGAAARAENEPRLTNGGIALEVSARAFLAAYLTPSGQIKILSEQNADERLPIASLTKLITASVAPRDSQLLYPLLIESNNSAAVILANQIGQTLFVDQMNRLVIGLGLNDTRFYNPSGLDPAATSTDQSLNYSTAHDLLRLASQLVAKRPDLLQITALKTYPVASTTTGLADHLASNTNELLNGQTWSPDIVGGKTGTTDLAKKNLLLILKKPSNFYLITIILGADDNFAATTNLVNWVYQSYEF